MSHSSLNDNVNPDEANIPLPAPQDASLPLGPIAKLPQHIRSLWKWFSWRKITLFAISLMLFILAIVLMKEGARALAPLIQDQFSITNPANSLGFGWLFAYVVMSGSPVAAASLAFFEAGVLNALSTFTMITGSRLGASFIVLFIGFIYVLRGRNKAASLNMGLLSLTVTGTTYTAALIVGLALLRSGSLNRIQLQSGTILSSLTDVVFDPVAAWLLAFVPRWSLFAIGLGIILVSFNLFDKCLPEMAIKESQVGKVSQLVYRPWVMFLLGAGVTLVSMSVSLSLSILVPLSHRGFVRRENVIPYIMGANITTFVDTLLAAALLNNPTAFTIVLVEMISIAIVSCIILLTFYGFYERGILNFVEWVTADNRHLALFMATILVVPLLLLFL
jgi:solute carrier family 34 (sodium-dependent phosphate cotransporter)